MKKKTVRRKSSRTSKRSTSYNRYLIIGFVVAALLFIAAASYQTLKNANVLGTSSFLAKDGVESSGDGNKSAEVSQENKGSQTVSNQGSSQEVKTPEVKEVHTPEPREIETPEPRIIKPQLNSITNLPPQKVEVQVEGNKMEINAAEAGSQVQLKTEDDGSLKVHVKKADGTEVEVEKNALDDINESLKEDDIEISTKSAGGFEITNKNTKAETEFPLNVNLSTKTLSVDTPLGVKNLTVLPDQAVQSVLGQKILDRISQSTPSGTDGTQLQLVQLKLFANQPVFQVQGVDNKRFLAVLPVGVQKTALVSAETGQVVRTNLDLVNSILNILSVQ